MAPGDPDEALRGVLRALSTSAREANLARTAVLEEALTALDAGALGADQREGAVAAAHQVAGSAGTFGRRRSSELALQLERWFRAGPDRDSVSADVARARAQVAELRADLAAAHQDDDCPTA